ncbi:MAG: GAF and ANTAR domain-containing protein, partial [Acidimicrobiales bacterium]|nr:GAF and ANTAR domain-containing protein [Acidimicrobiales bacterium]
LAHRCVELLHATEAGVVLADPRGVLRSVASSNEQARLLELFELQNDEGPCLDCYRTGAQTLNEVLETSTRWPVFGPEARRRGFAMVHALPMRLRGEVIGAVNAFADDTDPLTRYEIDLGQAFADVATVGLLQERGIREARVLNEQLQGALNSRIVIEQAKGMLAERHQIDVAEGFESLRRYARDHNLRLAEVAQALLDGTIPPQSFNTQDP